MYIYIPIRAYIIHIHKVYVNTHMHTHIQIYVHTHTCIAVHTYMNSCLLMDVGIVRVYRILRVMPQPAINIPNISFVTKVRNYNF